MYTHTHTVKHLCLPYARYYCKCFMPANSFNSQNISTLFSPLKDEVTEAQWVQAACPKSSFSQWWSQDLKAGSLPLASSLSSIKPCCLGKRSQITQIMLHVFIKSVHTFMNVYIYTHNTYLCGYSKGANQCDFFQYKHLHLCSAIFTSWVSCESQDYVLVLRI